MKTSLRKTKIVVTLGPSTDINDNLEKIILSGANVVRLNFSHGNFYDHFIRSQKVRLISKKYNLYIALLGDLQGPKIRISKFKNNEVLLHNENTFILDANKHNFLGNEEIVSLDYKELPNYLNSGDILLLSDGKIKLKVLKIKNNQIITKVILGGILSNHKGINKLGGGLSAHSLTEKDQKDILAAAKIDVDYLAISFPRYSHDIYQAKELLKKAGSNAKIVAKIERAEIVQSNKFIDDIILASDAIMVARGDLGIEIGDSKLIRVQKKLIKRARHLNKIVITATQMMDSMINNPMPTRAEVMDVANAVLDGTDAVMLSEETAKGKYPAETVLSMANICLGAETISKFKYEDYKFKLQFNSEEETIILSSIYISNIIKKISSVITITENGDNVLIMSRIISNKPIFALSTDLKILNLVSLYRGVIPVYFDKYEKSIKLTYQKIIDLLLEKKFIFGGDSILLTQDNFRDKKETIFQIKIINI